MAAASPPSPDPAPTPDPVPSPIPDPTRKRRGWGRRLGCVLLFLLTLPVLVYGLYLASAQVFLSTGLGERLLSRHPERFRLEWQGGTSWVPGTFELEGVRLRGRTRKGRWELMADSAALRIDIRALLDRRAVFPELRLGGVNGAWSSDAADPSDGELPVIDGFSGNYSPPSPRPPGKTPWTLHFQDVQAEVRTLWVDHQRVEAGESPGRARLELVIVPRQEVEIPSLELAMDGAVAHADDGGRGEVETLRLRAQVDPFRPGEVQGLAWLKLARAELEMKADGWGLGAASYYFRGAPVDLGGVGRAEARLLLDAGHLRPGSVFALEGDALSFDYLGYRGTGAGRLDLKVEGGEEKGADDGARADLLLELHTFGVARERGAEPYVKGRGLRLEASTDSTDLADPQPAIRAKLSLDSAQIPDFAAYDAYLPDGVPLALTGGSGELSSTLVLDTGTGRAHGRVKLLGDDVRGRFEAHELEGDLRAEVVLADGDLNSLRFRIDSATLLLDNVESGGAGPEGVTGWWARVEVPEGSASLRAGAGSDGEESAVAKLEAARIDARFAATLADARPFLALLGDRRRAVSWLERLVGYGRVTVSGHLETNEESLRLVDLDLIAGSHWRGRSQLYLADGTYGGLALVTYGRLAAAFEVEESQLREWKLIGADKFYRQREERWRRRLGER